MLICQNCSTVQEAGVQRCRHCQMPGQLVPYQYQALKAAAQPYLSHTCQNCGSETRADAERCGECRFPLPVHQRLKKHDHASDEERRRRVG